MTFLFGLYALGEFSSNIYSYFLEPVAYRVDLILSDSMFGPFSDVFIIGGAMGSYYQSFPVSHGPDVD